MFPYPTMAAGEVMLTVGKFIRTTEAAERLNVSPRTVIRWIEQGKFPGAFQVNPDAENSPYLIPENAVEAYQKRQRGEGDAGEGNED